MGTFAIVFVSAMVRASAAFVQAASWQVYDVNDRHGAVIGRGLEFRGELDAGYGARAAFLNAECADGKTIVRVEVRKHDFGVRPMTVRWRPGENGERKDTWEPCDDGTCIGLWEGQGVVLVKSLPRTKTLTLIVEARDGKPMRATFNVEASGRDFRSVGLQCGWP